MSYTVYKTEAIILRLIPQGEGSQDVVLLTEQFGKITVRAQSARELRSTMRMHLVRFRQVTVDIIRGKIFWRLVGVTSHEPIGMIPQSFINIMRLVEHLIVGELHDPHFFSQLIHLREQSRTTSAQTFPKEFEIFGVVTILERLGYWNYELLGDLFNESCAAIIKQDAKNYVQLINQSLQATQIMV